MSRDVCLAFPAFFPLCLGGLEGALGEWPTCKCPDPGAPSAAPAASRNGDVGGGGTLSSPASTSDGASNEVVVVASAGVVSTSTSTSTSSKSTSSLTSVV